ncbi:MAG: HD domain-containing protein [Proteobacteria bacterium]|nr:HD domain-containing protein [Pseudomonadota bacterium]
MADYNMPITLPRPVIDLVPAKLPPIFRVTSIERLPVDNRNHRVSAKLYHEEAALAVTWIAPTVDVRITKGSLVGIRWLGNPTSVDGVIRIARLVQMERPEASFNLFRTVPYTWVKGRELVQRGADLWEQLPRGFQHMFNAILWDAKRFQRYLMGPSSMNGHHKSMNGNFLHSIEVAERALSLARDYEGTFAPVLILGGLLHDAGKADEYVFDHRRQVFSMSERGALIGHRYTVLEWIAAARAKHRVIVPEAHYLALLHALTAAKGAPEWLGIRQPMSMDATILSMADRLSGHGDLHAQLAPDESGFGRYHRHLGGRPYVVS